MLDFVLSRLRSSFGSPSRGGVASLSLCADSIALTIGLLVSMSFSGVGLLVVICCSIVSLMAGNMQVVCELVDRKVTCRMMKEEREERARQRLDERASYGVERYEIVEFN
jgi:hypothetical protein